MLDVRRVFAGDGLPSDLSDTQGLVVMGGPASAYSDDGFPTRRQELGLLHDALQRGVPTLGICLGAQLLALASDGEVFPGDAGPEIGWGPVRLTEEAVTDPLLAGLPREITVLHWHGDTFRVGPGAVLLASTRRYPAQALRVGPAAWALQFHVEVDAPQVASFLAAFPDDAAHGQGGAEDIAGGAEAALATLRGVAEVIGGRFAVLVAGG